MKRQTVIVVYCDGRRGSSRPRRPKHRATSHDAVPISAYRMAADRDTGEQYWHPVYSVMFRGTAHVLETNSTHQLVGEAQLSLPDAGSTVDRPLTGVDVVASIRSKVQAFWMPYVMQSLRLRSQTGCEQRSQYRWRCPQPGCYDLMFDDVVAAHRLFGLYAQCSTPEVSLAELDSVTRRHGK